MWYPTLCYALANCKVSGVRKFVAFLILGWGLRNVQNNISCTDDVDLTSVLTNSVVNIG